MQEVIEGMTLKHLYEFSKCREYTSHSIRMRKTEETFLLAKCDGITYRNQLRNRARPLGMINKYLQEADENKYLFYGKLLPSINCYMLNIQYFDGVAVAMLEFHIQYFQNNIGKQKVCRIYRTYIIQQHKR